MGVKEVKGFRVAGDVGKKIKATLHDAHAQPKDN